MSSESFVVNVFCAKGDLTNIKTKTDEEVVIANVRELSNLNMIENLHWLILLAIDFMEDKRPIWTEINY